MGAVTRKQRKAAKRAAGPVRGATAKGKPTPKRPPGNMTREAWTRAQGRKARRALDAPGAATRAVEALRAARTGERDAIERLLREAGGVDLSHLRGRGKQ